jgi:hypothetical protein
MNRKIFWLALAVLALPILIRLVWFFPGFNFPRAISTPDYQNLKLPVAPKSTVQVEEIKKLGGTVLIDNAHANQFQPSEIQSLTNALTQRGAGMEFNSDQTTLPGELKFASAFVVISPSIAFSSDDIRLIREFVSRGGRLAVFTDATRGQVLFDFSGNPVSNAPDVNISNPLLEPFGISINGDYLYDLVENEGNFRNVYFTTFGKSDLTWGLSKIALYGTHSVETSSGSALIVGSNNTLSSSTDTTPANDSKQNWDSAVLSKDGNVLAMGDFTFLTPPYDTVADNATLINNLADFLLNGQKKLILADFPYIFNQAPVGIQTTSNVQLTAEITGAIARLQSRLAMTNTPLNVLKNPPADGNLIVLGTYSSSDDMTKYVEPFNIQLDDTSEFVEIPQLGKFGRSGNGLLLFSHSEKGSTLVLLADTTDDLTSLIDTLSSGDLTGCVLQGDLGVCSIGVGGSFSEGGIPTPETTPLPGEIPVTATPPG